MVVEYVPGGQAVALMEERGQRDPAGQRMGAPLEQKKEAGQGTQVSWRMRLLLRSAVKRTPEGEMARKIGTIKPADTPKPFA